MRRKISFYSNWGTSFLPVLLHATIRQQLCVVRMYVGCIKINKFYFLFHAELFCSVICSVCLCYCDVRQSAQYSFFRRDNKVILNLLSRGRTFGGVYVPCIYSHARWSYRRRFRSLLLCPLSVERCYFPLFLDSCLLNLEGFFVCTVSYTPNLAVGSCGRRN